MNRRRFLATAGGALVAALAGLSASRAARASAPRRLLVVWNAGGWDPTFVFDPHFDDAGVAGDPGAEPALGGGISYAAATGRPSVSAFFERYGDRSLVVNGLSVGSISHDGCTRLLLTGTRADGGADLPTRVAAATGADLPLPYVVLSGPRFPGGLGASVVPLNATLSGVASGTLPSGWSPDDDAEAAVRGWLDAEAAGLSGARAASYRAGLTQLGALEAAIGGLSVPDDPTDERLRELAVDTLASGLCRAVMVGGGLPAQTTWDSHFANADNQSAAFEHVFDGLNDLLDALDRAAGEGSGSLLDETTVLVLSEMGRAPALNSLDGKDHWPHTSALLIGAGISGGRVIGATDEGLASLPVDLDSGDPWEGGERVRPAHLLAALLELFDVDPAEAFPGVTPLRGIST